MVFADLVFGIIILLLLVVTFPLLRWLGTVIVRRRQIAALRNREPWKYGDPARVPVIEKRGSVEVIPK